jgi:hypothetical protein
MVRTLSEEGCRPQKRRRRTGASGQVRACPPHRKSRRRRPPFWGRALHGPPPVREDEDGCRPRRRRTGASGQVRASELPPPPPIAASLVARRGFAGVRTAPRSLLSPGALVSDGFVAWERGCGFAVFPSCVRAGRDSRAVSLPGSSRSCAGRRGGLGYWIIFSTLGTI